MERKDSREVDKSNPEAFKGLKGPSMLGKRTEMATLLSKFRLAYAILNEQKGRRGTIVVNKVLNMAGLWSLSRGSGTSVTHRWLVDPKSRLHLLV